jgi:hypothetical protein
MGTIKNNLFDAASNIAIFLTNKGSEIAKGLILISWYATLVVAVSIAYKGLASDSITKFYDNIYSDSSVMLGPIEDTPITSPLDYLYFEYQGEYPKNILVILLNSMQPSWSKKSFFSDVLNKKGEMLLWAKDKYYVLFITAEAYLKTAIENSSVNLSEKINLTEILSQDFLITENTTVTLPMTVQNWINKQRENSSFIQARKNLADTFLILIILGTFGSLIFLTRDYISNSNGDENNIASYLFRPLFGMAMAMAMFIVDMVAHSVISTGGIENIRNETMYLLGLSSGLLAEKAYEILQQKARHGLKGNAANKANPADPKSDAPTP